VSVEARLRLLEDREEIRLLLTTYARHLDAGDYAAYSELFAEEGELVARLGSARGPAAIRALLERSLGQSPRPTAFHLLANPLIEVDGDRATARTLWAYVTEDDEGYPQILQLGHYADVLTRERGRWRFLRRDISRDIGYAPYEEHPRSRR
jgi:3-phenylpropionate/cinnamic acid dioxygenase small subunit